MIKAIPLAYKVILWIMGILLILIIPLLLILGKSLWWIAPVILIPLIIMAVIFLINHLKEDKNPLSTAKVKEMSNEMIKAIFNKRLIEKKIISFPRNIAINSINFPPQEIEENGKVMQYQTKIAYAFIRDMGEKALLMAIDKRDPDNYHEEEVDANIEMNEIPSKFEWLNVYRGKGDLSMIYDKETKKLRGVTKERNIHETVYEPLEQDEVRF